MFTKYIQTVNNIVPNETLPLILQLDISGNPRRWITYETAAYYVAKDLVAYTLGQGNITLRGGENARTGLQSLMDINSIIAVKGDCGNSSNRAPGLTNRGLFRRDHHICAYCGHTFDKAQLTRDHITPSSKGGPDTWMNVVTACSGCNKAKNDRTPEEAHMKLLYVPYVPTKHEHLILMNRHILADQQEFLMAKVPSHSRLHQYLN